MGYPFPPSPLLSAPVQWTGQGFVTEDGHALDVLCYDETASNWNVELTRYHEAEAGANHPIDIASRRMAIQSIRRHVASEAPVLLDVGCSSGHLLGELASAFPGAQLIGADFIPEVLRRIAPSMPGVPLVQFDLRHCPLPDASVDAVTCLNVLEHIDDDEAALRHIKRILKPGGIAHVEVPAGPGLYDIYDQWLMHHRRYRMRDLLALARRVGLQPVRRNHLGFFLFPAFAIVKRWGRRKLELPAAEKEAIVTRRIRSTRRSAAFGALIGMEAALSRVVRFPVGIRCVAVLRKP